MSKEDSKKIYKSPSINECIQLIQLLPVSKIDNNIDGISSIIYDNDDLLNEFTQKTDNRIEICNEDKEGKFIKCEQNRYGDSYRSPLSNTYFPNINDGYFPNENLRKLEI
jgi:capping protein beta